MFVQGEIVKEIIFLWNFMIYFFIQVENKFLDNLSLLDYKFFWRRNSFLLRGFVGQWKNFRFCCFLDMNFILGFGSMCKFG